MPEPQEKKPWEKFAAPVVEAGPWDKYQGAGTKKSAVDVPPKAAPAAKSETEGVVPKVLRGAELGAFAGAGIAETQHPVRDTARGYAEQAKTVAKFWTLKHEDMKASLLANPVVAIPRAMTEGFLDVIKDINPLIDNMFRHLSTQQYADKPVDPEKTAHDISQLATSVLLLKGGADEHSTLVDGTLKAADKIAKQVKVEPTEALTTAHKLTEGAPSRILKRRAFEDAYVHSRGLDIAKKIGKAAKSVQEEVKTHASGIAEQIDTKIPTGIVDASAEAATIMKEFQDVVKTPEKAHPVLVQMVKDAQATAPKLWSWEKARQFRSSVGRAMSGDRVVGPQKVVLTKVYIDLTKKLSGAAKQYGLEKSWNQYNELASKMDKEFSDITDSITDAKSGQEVAQKLSKDVALTSELSKNLSKYGLKHKEVLQFVNTSKRIAATKNFMNRSLFRLVYGSPPGLMTAMSLRMAGAPYIAALGGGALVGLSTSYLVGLARILKLSPDIIESMMNERALPGKMKFEPGTFPGAESAAGLPETTGGGEPPQLPEKSGPSGPSEPITGEPESERIRRLGPGSKEAPKPTAEEIEGHKARTEKSLVEKVEAGRHGKGKLAEQSKARERITKNRGEAKRTREAQETEAKARAQATHFDVSALQIPEMEEYLRAKNPTALKGLIKMRKLGTPDVEYIEALKYLILEDFEK